MNQRRALISVFDKTGVGELARDLSALGFEIVSTGGTARHLEQSGVSVIPIAAVTGFPEVLDGRVKSLHPSIHAGILADLDKAAHEEQLSDLDITQIDVVVVNLYPFAKTVASGASRADCIEMIDIGGPSMLRAAAKNHARVWVLVDPSDYADALETIGASVDNGSGNDPESNLEDSGLAFRRRLARKAFTHSAAYDAEISAWMNAQEAAIGDEFPEIQTLRLRRHLVPRYGENPHQQAAVYRFSDRELFGGYTQHQGKLLSYNNLLDADAARSLAAALPHSGVAIVKHNNPCGVGIGDSAAEAYQRALACDPVSAFGSVIGVNGEVDESLAEALQGLFVEVIVAPAYSDTALRCLSGKSNLRLIEADIEPTRGVALRSIDGGLLAQQVDAGGSLAEATVATERSPTEDEFAALELAWTVVAEVRSNAIVIANHYQTVGIGAGQMSRVDSCRIAINKAELPLEGTAAGSDAFFPFADGLETLAEAGVTAVVQPGGSRRDDEVIDAANRLGVAMLMTGRRHFKH